MKKCLTALVLAAAFMTPLAAYADEPTTVPSVGPTTRVAETPKDLADTIKKAIELLEANKNQETIELLAPPDVIKREGMDKMLPKFEKRARQLLDALKESQAQKPTLAGDERAVYPKSETDKDRPQLRFQKVEGKWYLH
jgi:hypothetical protein